MLQEKKIAKLSLLSKTLLASERAKAIAKGEKKEELHDNNSNSATEVTFVSSLKYKMKTNLIIFEYVGNYNTFLEHFRSCPKKRLLQRRPKLHLKAKCHRKLLRLRILQSHSQKSLPHYPKSKLPSLNQR